MKMLYFKFLIVDLGYPLNSLRVCTRRHRAPLLRVLHRLRLRARMLFELFAAAFHLVVSRPCKQPKPRRQSTNQMLQWSHPVRHRPRSTAPSSG